MAGCTVPQPRGDGKLLHLREPQTDRRYYLYLPYDYVQTARPDVPKRWPVVVTFHGMKPFDNYSAQSKEWQQEADNYGLIVIAPHLKTSDLFMEFPLRNVHSYVRDDERAVLAIIHEVFRTTQADTTRVLATSWSSGGYMAHYMVNRHPNLFTCLAPRQSNFSASVLEASNIPYYLDTPIGIFFGENDFAVCREESTDAVRWYREHGFRFVDGRVVVGLGHERTPQTAAAFFARTSKPPIQPVRPIEAQASLAKLRLLPAEFAGIRDLAGTKAPADEALTSRQQPAPTVAGAMVPSQQQGRLLASNTNTPVVRPVQLQPAPPAGRALQPQPLQPGSQQAAGNPTRISVSTRIGLAPLHISFAVQMPPELMDGATCTWSDNDQPICTGITGQRILATPGDHTLGVTVKTRDGREYRSWTTVKVLPRQGASQ